MRTLTNKQNAFAELYVKYGGGSVRGSGPRAMRECYPERVDWKVTSLYSAVTRLLNNDLVAARIKEIRDRASHSLDITPERVLREYSYIGFADYGEMFDQSGALLPVGKMPKAIRAAVSSVKVTSNAQGDAVTELRLVNKVPALEAMSKYLNLFDQVKVSKPTAVKGTHEYAKEAAEGIVKLRGNYGLSLHDALARVGVLKAEHKKMMTVYKDYAAAIKDAHKQAKKWWVSQVGRMAISGRGNDLLLRMYLQREFDVDLSKGDDKEQYGFDITVRPKTSED